MSERASEHLHAYLCALRSETRPSLPHGPSFLVSLVLRCSISIVLRIGLVLSLARSLCRATHTACGACGGVRAFVQFLKYGEVYDQVATVGAGLQELGVKPQSPVLHCTALRCTLPLIT